MLYPLKNECEKSLLSEESCYLYRPAHKSGNTVDSLLTRKRKRMSAQSFLIKAISNNYRPTVINIDKSGSNIAAIKVCNKRSFSKIKIRECKYGNNILEKDHHFIKWKILNGLGFKNFESARRTLSGIEVVHMLRKNHMINPWLTIFKSFRMLAA